MKDEDQAARRKRDVDRTVKLTWKDIPELELRAALERVTTGYDPVASMQLIEYFYRRIHDHLPYDQSVLVEYLDHVLGGIVGGEAPDVALGLKPRDARK
jgi:hypothetical protein